MESGDGSDTFGLPNLEARFPIGYNGSTYTFSMEPEEQQPIHPHFKLEPMLEHQ